MSHPTDAAPLNDPLNDPLSVVPADPPVHSPVDAPALWERFPASSLEGVDATRALWSEVMPGGSHWSWRMPRGSAIRFVALEAGANVSVVMYSALEKLERYNMPDSLKAQHTAHYGKGHVLMSDMGRSMASVTADSLVETQPPAELDDSPPWEAVREHMQYRAQAPFKAASEFVFPSPYAQRDDAFADFARPLFAARRPFLDACHDLMAKIHRELQYETASTEVHTPALQALDQRKGVCQDFAHIMIGCLRSLGLPARYVSGYLLTQPPPGQPRLLGADASHAWVSVWVPTLDAGGGTAGGCWQDLDPTNNRPAGEDYVTLAVGRDYSDVSPVRGVIHGGARHTLSVAVTVTPTHLGRLEDASAATATGALADPADGGPPAGPPLTDDRLTTP